MTIHIAAFSGSLRKGSLNSGLLRVAAGLLPDQVTFEILDISGIPLFNEDIEKPRPAPVQLFREKVQAADALMIATPEYNHSMPGTLKNVLDWGSRSPNVFDGKPLAILGAGGQFGTTRAQYHLRQVATALNMFAVNVPQVLVFNGAKKFDENLNLMDEDARQLIAALVSNLVALTRRLRS
ncbi:MAG: NAD(P)H-dependent oxidoreductase [Anaerolineales bacterium]|jgi:chromate reductase|nr:NAD(P)H-dependent oxidoreductase [Anaerolineales bacterium]